MIAFAKYHGCGNNFIIVMEDAVLGRDFAALAVEICDNNVGIGADGLIIVRTQPALEMIFYNRDGSRAPMCGNGIRCFANYCFDRGINREQRYDVNTLAGVMQVNVLRTENPFTVEINMGQGRDFSQQSLETSKGKMQIHDCFMGTVHSVVFADEMGDGDMEALGCELSNHPAYPEKTNVNFVRIIDEKTLEVRTYERGVGMTLACGTGACASVITGAMKGKCQREADVVLPLGTLHITQDADGFVTMAGPAQKIAEGIYI